MLSLTCRRNLQTGIHPHKFIRLLKLTDGSTIRVSTLSAPPPLANTTTPISPSYDLQTTLNLDAANHPSWNPLLRDKILLDDRGEVAKFRNKFKLQEEFGGAAGKESKAVAGKKGNSNAKVDDFAMFAEMDPSLGAATAPIVPVKEAPKKKPSGNANSSKKK